MAGSDYTRIITRKEAREAGEKRYFTGKSCKNGHAAERLVSNGSCMECFGLRQKAIYHANLAESRQKQKIRRDNDPNLAAKKFARRLRQDPDLLTRKATRQIDIDARNVAKDEGRSKYQSMRPCAAYGHIGFRFTADTKCVECNRINCFERHHSKPSKTGKEPFARRTLSEIRVAAAARRAARLEAKKWWADLKAARQLAIASGAKTYVGRQCPLGHDGLRYTNDGACLHCAAAYSSSEAKKQYDLQYSARNREKIRLRSREYYENNRSRAAECTRNWVAKNPEKRRTIANAYKHRRRTREAGGDSTAALHAWETAAPKVCYWCGIKCPKKYHIDHYEPLSKGGKHVVANLVIACPKCNLTKNAKDPYEFAASVGRLF